METVLPVWWWCPTELGENRTKFHARRTIDFVVLRGMLSVSHLAVRALSTKYMWSHKMAGGLTRSSKLRANLFLSPHQTSIGIHQEFYRAQTLDQLAAFGSNWKHDPASIKTWLFVSMKSWWMHQKVFKLYKQLLERCNILIETSSTFNFPSRSARSNYFPHVEWISMDSNYVKSRVGLGAT